MLKFDWQVRLSVYHDLSRMYYLTKYLGQRAISIEKMCFLTQPHTIFIEQCFPAYSSYHLERNPRYLIKLRLMIAAIQKTISTAEMWLLLAHMMMGIKSPTLNLGFFKEPSHSS